MTKCVESNSMTIKRVRTFKTILEPNCQKVLSALLAFSFGLCGVLTMMTVVLWSKSK